MRNIDEIDEELTNTQAMRAYNKFCQNTNLSERQVLSRLYSARSSLTGNTDAASRYATDMVNSAIANLYRLFDFKLGGNGEVTEIKDYERR